MTPSANRPAQAPGQALARLCAGAENLSILMLMAMTVLIVLQVIARNLLNVGWPWAEELARYAGLTLVYMAAPLLLLRNKHIVVDILSARVRGLPGRLLQLVNELLTLTFCGLFLWGGWAFIQQAGKFSTAALGMPNTLYYLPALLGMALLTLVCLARVVQKLRELPAQGARA